MTSLQIVPKWKDKSARFKGTVAAGEHVAVSIVNDNGEGGAYVASTEHLRLRVVGPDGRVLAQFPMPEDSTDADEVLPTSELEGETEGETEGANEWGSDTTPLQCELNLNTVQMLRAVPPGSNVPLLFVLDDIDAKTLYFKEFCEVTHWPRRCGEDEPVDLDGYADFVANITEELASHTGNTNNPHEVTKAQIGLGNVDNTSDAAKPVSTAVAAALALKYAKPGTGIPKSDLADDVKTSLGKADTALQSHQDISGKADLQNGKVPASQLPSYVDDVLEYDSISEFPATGEEGKIYVDKATNRTYRWSGTQYTEIANPALDNAVTHNSANGVKSSGVWSAIWGALTALPTGFTSLYDWCVSQLAGKANASHTHGQSDVTGLTDALAARPTKTQIEEGWWTRWTILREGVDVTSEVSQPTWEWDADDNQYAWRVRVKNDEILMFPYVTMGVTEDSSTLTWRSVGAGYTAARQRVVTDASLEPIYDDNWNIVLVLTGEQKAAVYDLDPATAENDYAISLLDNNTHFGIGAGIVGNLVVNPQDPSQLLSDGYAPVTGLVVATRTPIGYRIVSHQTDKLLQPMGSYAPSVHTHAQSDVTGLADALAGKADKSAVDPMLFAQYYPDGSVTSAAEFTPGIKYDTPNTTNRTITVKTFCNTGTAANDNSGLVGRVVIPPFVDASGNGYIFDDGTKYKVVGVSGGVSVGSNTSLTAIVASATLTTIGSLAFPDCTSLTSVSLPAATTIGNAAFYECASLISVSLPAATTIADGAFDSCTSLTSVDFGGAPRSSVPHLGIDAFSDVPTSCQIIVPYAQYNAWIAASRWSSLTQAFVRHAEKADKPATFTTGNLAALDAQGNATDSTIPAANVAMNGDIPYDLGTPTVINAASSETVEGETVYYGAATLADRTANIVQVTATLDELRITFPAATSGKVRDFGLRVEIGTGSAALAAPALVPVEPTGETITLMNAEGEMPTLADGTTTASGFTVLYFTEIGQGTFLVKGEQIQEVA